MQTPAGYKIVNGRFYPADWLAIIFNPSFPYRFAHTVCAFYITTGFVVLGVAAWLIAARPLRRWKGRQMFDDARGCCWCWCRCRSSSATCTGSTRSSTSRRSLRRWRRLTPRRRRAARRCSRSPTRRRGPIATRSRSRVSAASSSTHAWNGAVKGLKECPADQRPPVAIVVLRLPRHGRRRRC